MSRMRVTLVPLFLVALALAPVAGQDQPKDEKKYAPMPWHLVDTWWDIGQDTPFESLAVDVTISADVPSSVSLYNAPNRFGPPEQDPVLRRHPDTGGRLHEEKPETSHHRPRLPSMKPLVSSPICIFSLFCPGARTQ
jgi:hypothetical protein